MSDSQPDLVLFYQTRFRLRFRMTVKIRMFQIQQTLPQARFS